LPEKVKKLTSFNHLTGGRFFRRDERTVPPLGPRSVSGLQGLKHPFDDNGAGDLTIGGLGDDEGVRRLDNIIRHDEVSTYGQSVEELTVVGP